MDKHSLGSNWPVEFKVVLGETYYYKQGCINPGAEVSKCLGEHGEEVTLILDGEKLKKKINRRTAHVNGAVRIYVGRKLIEFYQKKHSFEDDAYFVIRSKNEIEWIGSKPYQKQK